MPQVKLYGGNAATGTTGKRWLPAEVSMVTAVQFAQDKKCFPAIMIFTLSGRTWQANGVLKEIRRRHRRSQLLQVELCGGNVVMGTAGKLRSPVEATKAQAVPFALDKKCFSVSMICSH